MGIAYKTVLVPVDFSMNTDIAVKKAAGLVGISGAVMHLLHIVTEGQLLKEWMAVKRLEHLADRIRNEYQEMRVMTHVYRSYFVQRSIIRKSMELAPDLIVIGKKQKLQSWGWLQHISPRTIARKTDCPVLTVNPGSVNERMRIIVIPISDGVSERKLEWGVMLARKYKARIHLLALQESGAEGQMPGAFLRAYHYLRERLHIPIEFSTAGQQNPARAASDCARKVQADMILVNPETESWVGGLRWARHISDLLEKNSGIQVLEVGK